jgi:DNA-binding winged helix-turn-helix (wHTH) protein
MVRSSGESTTDSLLSRTAPVRFATFTLDLDGCSLLRADGGVVALTHSEFALLREFVRHNGRVLSRDYLLDALVGKRAGPFDRGVDMLVGRLRRKIEADPKKPRLIVTVPGEGYRFDGLTKRFHSAPTGRPRTRRPARVEPRNVVGGADEPMDGAAGSAAWPEHPAAPRLSLVVLPFANIGGDASQDYFVDGVAESLTTDLSRISGGCDSKRCRVGSVWIDFGWRIQMEGLELSDEALTAALRAHPELRKRMSSIVLAVEGDAGELKEADAAEERIVDEMRLLGREALKSWAENRVEATEREIRQRPQMHRQGEKNSAGIRSSGK